MSIFYVRAWVTGSQIIAVRTGEGQIDNDGSYAGSTYVDAIGEGSIIDAGTLFPTLAYTNNKLTSSLVNLIPAKDVTSLLAEDGFVGQQVYNWTDESFYQWNGNPWDASMSAEGVLQTVEIEADSLFTDQGLNFIKDVDELPAEGDYIGQKVFLTTNGKLYSWTGTEWVLVVAAVEAPDISGELATNQIALDAITSDLIANEAVLAANIADLAVSSDKIANLSITSTKIDSDAITTPKIATNAVTAVNIQAGAILTDKLATNAITSTKIAAGAIIAEKIGAGEITAIKIATDAVTANKIVAGAITTNKIAAGAITSNEIAANTITGDNITANTITGGLLATSGIITNTAQINNGIITTAKIGTAEITTLLVDGNAITLPTESDGGTTVGDGIIGNVVTDVVPIPSGVTGNIRIFWGIQHGYSAGAKMHGWRLFVDGTLVDSRGSFTGGSFPALISGPNSISDYIQGQYTAFNESGNVSVILQWAGEDSGITCQAARLTCFLSKR